jgi:hypothetical protein
MTRNEAYQRWVEAETALQRALAKGKPSLALQEAAKRAETAFYMAEGLDNWGIDLGSTEADAAPVPAVSESEFAFDDVFDDETTDPEFRSDRLASDRIKR